MGYLHIMMDLQIESEIWKQIIYKGVITNYEASTHGRIRNIKTKYILKQHKCLEGYCYTNLYINRLPKTLIVHPLIISTFKSNPKNLKHVNHIDMVRDNNHIDNLEWTTCSDNQKHAVKNNLNRKSIKKIIYQFSDSEKINIINIFPSVSETALALNIHIDTVMSNLTGKTRSKKYFFDYAIKRNVITDVNDLVDFEPVKNHPRYLIHRDGRVYSFRTKQFLKPILKKGYHHLSLNTIPYIVHRLVAMQYLPNPDNKEFVNHKDGNKINNHVNNLEWSSVSENTQHAIDTGLLNITRVINQYDAHGNFIKRHTSIVNAAKYIGVNIKNNSIIECLGHRQTHAYGFIWRYENDETPVEPICEMSLKLLVYRIMLLKNNIHIASFSSLKEMVKYTGLKESYIIDMYTNLKIVKEYQILYNYGLK